MFRKIAMGVAAIGNLIVIAACTQTAGGNGPTTSSVDGANSINQAAGSSQSKAIEPIRCDAPIATVVLASDQQAAQLAQYGLPSSSLPAMRLVARQSNCFTLINRDVAQQTVQAERTLRSDGSSGNFGAGRITTAEYTMMVEVLVSKESGGAGSAGSALLGFIPYVGGIASIAATGVRTHDAQVLLTLIDNRSAVEVTSVTGRATGASYNLMGSGYGDAGGYDSSAQGKIVLSAMVDAMNQIIPQVGPTTRRRM